MEAIILAGGQSKRMGGAIPKPLIQARGMTIMEWQLRYLAQEGVTHVVVSVGFKGDEVTSFLEDLTPSLGGMQITVAKETEPLCTGGGLCNAWQYIDGEKAIVINCDDITDVRLEHLWTRPFNTICGAHPV